MKGRRLRGVGARLRESARIGVLLGAALSIYATLLLVVKGSSFFEERLGVPFLVVPVLYLAGGLLAGAGIGLLGPFATGFISHVLIGFLVALTPTFLGCLAMTPASDLHRLVLPCTLILATFWGGVGGAIGWYTRE